jgi:hypothetical protein
MDINVTINKQPIYGHVYWNGTDFVYTPNDNFSGNDYFIYTIDDGSGPKILTKNVSTVNRPPSALDIRLTRNTDDNIVIDVSDYVLDQDKLLQSLYITDISKPYYGTAHFDKTKIYYTSYLIIFIC